VATLSGTFLDLITDGVPPPVDRSAVIKAVRAVMLSAHRGGVPYSQVHDLLCAIAKRRLAVQLATGRGGRKTALRQRSQLLRDLWAQTGEVAATRPHWDRNTALAAIEHVRDRWSATEALPKRHQAVLNAVLDLATEYGTTRPTVPVREVEPRLSPDPSEIDAEADRLLERIAVFEDLFAKGAIALPAHLEAKDE
jgi:hypothetical protein